MEFPRTLVLGANPGRWNFKDANASFRDGNGIEAWAYALQGDYWGSPLARVAPEIREYELVIANLHPAVRKRYPRLQDQLRPDGKWVSLIEGDADAYHDQPAYLREILDRSDLVATINETTNPLFRSLTNSRVEFVGIPYPVEAMRSRRVPQAARRAEALLCPRQDRQPSIEVATASGLTVRAYAPKVSRKLSNLPRFLKAGHFARDLEVRRLAEQLPRGSIVEFEKDFEPFIDEVAGCKLWVNLDSRLTWARYVLDAAALGVPIVTTTATGHGPKLFPSTTVRDTSCTEDAIDAAKQLVQTAAFYSQVVEQADAGIDYYNYEQTAKRLLRLL